MPGKQSAHLGGFCQRLTDELDAVPCVQFFVGNAAADSLTVYIATVCKVYPEVRSPLVCVFPVTELMHLVSFLCTQVEPLHPSVHARHRIRMLPDISTGDFIVHLVPEQVRERSFLEDVVEPLKAEIEDIDHRDRVKRQPRYGLKVVP